MGMWKVKTEKLIPKVETLLEDSKGALNAYELCRILNGFGKEEYTQCYYSFQEKPKGTSAPNKRPCKNFDTCLIKVTQVQYAIKKNPKIQTLKTRAKDKGGIGTDTFRLLFLTEEQLQNRMGM